MITAVQEHLLCALSQFHVLTVMQLTRLFYSKRSMSHVHHMMRELYTAKYVDRFSFARPVRWGSNPFVYTLTHRGVRHAQHLGMDAFQTHHTAIKTYTWLAEVLAINDFLIAATLLHRVHSAITLPRALHERTIRHNRMSPLIPDSWIAFRYQEPTQEATQICIWLEMDMGTEQKRFFRKKVSAILDFASDGYAQVFGTRSLTVAIATPAGEKRAHVLRIWVEKELRSRHAKSKNFLFRVTALPSGELDPTTVFLNPTWHMPYQPHMLTPLLPVSVLTPASEDGMAENAPEHIPSLVITG